MSASEKFKNNKNGEGGGGGEREKASLLKAPTELHLIDCLTIHKYQVYSAIL